MTLYVNQSESIDRPIVIDQDNTDIRFAAGAEITASEGVENIIIIAANGVTIENARLGYSSVVQTEEARNFAIYLQSDDFYGAIADKVRTFNIEGGRPVSGNIVTCVLVSEPNRN